MNKNDYARLVSIIKSSYRAQWLDQEDLYMAFYNFCLQFDYDTCKAAVIDLVENGTEDGIPVTLAVIENRIKREARIRQRPETKAQGKTCPVCHDTGFIIKTYPTGTDYWRACDCAIGHEKYPWYFWTPEEEQEYWDEKQRRGVSKPNFYAPTPYDVVRQAKYDDEQTARYAEKMKARKGSGDRVHRARTQVH